MAHHRYRNVEVHIRQQAADETYVVNLHISNDNLQAAGVFVCPFSKAEVARALDWMEQGLFDTAYVKDFGATLFGALFAGAVRTLYDSSQQEGTKLRICLIIDTPAIARIPWELLYDPERNVFLSIEGAIVRGTILPEPTQPLHVPPPLRLLVIDAFPQGVPQDHNQVEARDIAQTLNGLIRDHQIDVTLLNHVTLNTLKNALRAQEEGRPFYALHIIGYGHHDPVSGRTVLLFEDDEGRTDEIEPKTLADILHSSELQLVFLSVSQSGQSSVIDLAQGFAPVLLESGIPSVTGMQITVLNQGIARFTRAFYTGLADHQPVDIALTNARQQAHSTWNRRRATLGMPVCYVQTARSQTQLAQPPIVDVPPLEQTAAPRRTWPTWLLEHMTLSRVRKQVWALIGVISTLLTVYGGIVPIFHGPPPMDGTLNVAVAQFGAFDAQGRAVESQPARALATSVYLTINNEVRTFQQEGLNIQVREPTLTGQITGADRAARARAAQRLARTYNIDVLVYGNITPSEEVTSFTSEFYVSDRTLKTAEELVGQYNWGVPIEAPGDVTTNPVASIPLRNALLSRTSALTKFIIGLGYYALDNYVEAATHFQAAEVGGWPNDNSRTVLYLFLGNTAGRRKALDTASRRKALDTAQEYYERALKINPEYARAWIGIAEVQFLKANGETCPADHIDVESLSRAGTNFQRALLVQDQPVGAALKAKVAFGVGRVNLCLSLARARNQWAAAEQAFQTVITEFESETTSAVKKELASEAHADLAYLYWQRPAPDDVTARADFQRAIEHYDQAINRSRHPDRKALFYNLQGQLYEQLKQYANADHAFAEIEHLDGLDPSKRSEYEQVHQQLQQQRAAPLDATPRPTL